MTRRRIFYFVRDWEPPSGGIRMSWRCVELLRDAGFDAYVLHRSRSFRPRWFRGRARVQWIDGGFHPRRDDFLVLPENHRPAYAVAPEIARRIIYCQGLYTVYRGFARTVDWRTWCSDILCASVTIDDFVRDVLRFERRTHIPCYVDRSLFHPEPKQLQIAYMPRKRRREATFIRECFRELAPDLRSVPWVPIDGRTEEEAAAILRRAAAFVSLGKLEGFGLPPLEAMACGCLVTGFPAGGGRDYATAENGDWVEEWDLVGCARALADRLRDGESHARRIAAALETADRYTIDATRDALTHFWSERLSS